MRRPGNDVDLGRRTPHHDASGYAALRLEIADVLAQLLGQLALVLAALDVGPFQTLDVGLVERRGHRLDGFQEVANRRHMLVLVEHAAVQAGAVRVVRHRVPGSKHQVVKAGQRDELVDQGGAVLGALAESDGGHLGERAVRLGDAPTDQLDAGDEGRRHRAEADAQHAQLALGLPDRSRCGIPHADSLVM